MYIKSLRNIKKNFIDGKEKNMIGIFPINSKYFDVRNLSVLKKIYKKIDIKFIFSGSENYQHILDELMKNDSDDIRKNSLIIKCNTFALKECLIQFINYHQHIISDNDKILLLDDDTMISTIKNASCIERLKEDEILLIDVYEEINKDPDFNLLTYKDHQNIVNSIYSSFLKKEKNNELILCDVVPVFHFKNLKKIYEGKDKPNTKESLIESMINDLSLRIIQSNNSGIRLNIYDNNNRELKGGIIPKNNEKNVIKTSGIENQKDVLSSNKIILNFVSDHIPSKYMQNQMESSWKMFFNFLANNNKYHVILRGDYMKEKFYMRKGAVEERKEKEKMARDMDNYNNNIINNEIHNNAVLNILFYNDDPLPYIEERKNVLIVGGNVLLLNNIILKKNFTNQNFNTEMKMYQYTDSNNKIFTIRTINSKSDIIDLYQNIQVISTLI